MNIPENIPEELSSWEMTPEFAADLQDIMKRVAENYTPRPLEPFPYTGDMVPPPDIILDKLSLYNGPLAHDASVHCEIYEAAGVSSLVEPHNKQWALWMRLKHHDELLFDGFLLHSNTPKWNFSHRLVPLKHRGKGIFKPCADALEAFVQYQADKTGLTQEVVLNTAQQDVISAVLKRGYTAADATQQQRLDRIQASDIDLIVDYARAPLSNVGGDHHWPLRQEVSINYIFDKK